MDANDPRHGTEAGYVAHRRAGHPQACEPCTLGMREARRARTAERFDDLALTGGEWQLVRGVKRWVRDGYNPAAVIACRTCGAQPHETCKTTAGKRRKPHPAREIPRSCPCGAPLPNNARGRTMCRPCAAESAQQAQIDYRERKRAA